jgi:hypothetical protein
MTIFIIPLNDYIINACASDILTMDIGVFEAPKGIIILLA